MYFQIILSIYANTGLLDIKTQIESLKKIR
jgi:hypothetical protein